MSQGIIYTLPPCGIVIGFDEILRSESCYIALHHLFQIIHLIDAENHRYIPKTIIYDNACRWYIYFWNRYGKNDINRRIVRTPSADFVSQCCFLIDLFHQSNYKRPMCQRQRNLDYVANNGIIKNINTEAAEQRNSVLKQYHNALSSYPSKKARVVYLILFHLMNLNVINVTGFTNIIVSMRKVNRFTSYN